MAATMQEVFQRFAQQLAQSRDANAVQAAMIAAADAFGLRCFAYLLLPRDNRHAAALISNYPIRWTSHYLKEHYERFDPVIVGARYRRHPFEWGLGASNQRMSPAQARLFDEASTFGIRCGLTIPLWNGGYASAAVTFASDERHRSFRKTVSRNRLVLQFMAATLHTHVRLKLYPDIPHKGICLSARERECLRWLAQGKSARDIAEILAITERTVVFHVENLKRKLGVRTVCQALAIWAHETSEPHSGFMSAPL